MPKELVANNWLDISTEGFAAENASRPKPHLAKELVQNALDAGATRIRVMLITDGDLFEFRIADNGSGIAAKDMINVRTVFWTSKQDSVLKRGRMGRGFKEMLCLAETATLESGRVRLNFEREDGEQVVTKEPRSTALRGTTVSMQFRWPAQVVQELEEYFATFLVPEGVSLLVNGRTVKPRPPKHQVEASLPTEAFKDGSWYRPSRETVVELVPAGDEEPTLFEMGIPVCDAEWDFGYHINVLQRVPMNPKRDAVQTGYTKRLHAAVLPTILEELSSEQVLSDTVGAVATSLAPEVQLAIIDKGFGSNIVRRVPQAGRRDFNDDAEDLGYRPVNIAQMSGGLREIVRTHVPSSKDVVDRAQQQEYATSLAMSFGVGEISDDNRENERRDREILRVGGKDRVYSVVEFAAWLCQRLLDSTGATLGGVKLAVFSNGTIATWSSSGELSLGLNHSATFSNPLGADTLSTYVHEVAHHNALHHGRNHHTEIERLSGVLGVVMFRYAQLIAERWPKLVESEA